MIKNLSIQNFQSHKSSELELSEGVNVIIGSSDSGKSSVIRALQWLVFNRPSGESFRSWWGGETKIEFKSDDHHIQRVKSKNINSYWADDQEDFKAFGQGVPEEVQQALNLSTINLQSQHDSPFLLSLSPGEVARYLNEIVNLEKIDSSLAHANKRIKITRTDIAYKEDSIKSLETELAEFDWLDQAEIELVSLEAKQKKIEIAETAKSDLGNHVDSIVAQQLHMEGFDKVLGVEVDVDKLLSIYSEIDKANTSKDQLIDMISHIQGEQDWIKEYDGLIDLEEPVKNLLKVDEQLDYVEQQKGGLFHLVKSIKKGNVDINGWSLELMGLEEEFNELMGDTCVLCGSQL